ncbi:MAG: rhomboid family intramembrane serine protease, partial [Nocardioides sp.]|nr:rhomboid family intramembrane serine protease [Nocardioides sp.]
MSDAPSPAGVPVCYRHPGREAHIRCQRCERPICPDCMTSASVGFQCPDCLREGRRTQRQPSRFTGVRLGYRAMPVTWVLIGLNVLVWLLITATGGNSSRIGDYLALRLDAFCATGNQLLTAATTHATCVANPGAHWYPGVDDGAVWQVLTSVFTHVQIWHIALNMLNLYVLGGMLEPILGRWRYLAFYLVSGLFGSALVLWVGPTAYTLGTLGASGALFGLMGVLGVMLLRSGQSLQPLVFPLLINFGITFTISGISWQAHVGGFIGGVLVALVA